jgi:NifB/MoaA-like Fe-S oxidoreductase
LFAPLLRSATDADVIPVANHFFGETVTVAGLLTAQDVIAQLQERELGQRVALPPAMFGGPEGRSLDGMLPEDVAQALGRPVVVGWAD